ncbi:hypothetical protein PUN28_008625 [Cardiocondyla obscurior]|uniref:Secreted protein n=1 Tax=Cardiocondyla obscurior TaxID=286306 RepID=A0AAW2G1U1_9HYME
MIIRLRILLSLSALLQREGERKKKRERKRALCNALPFIYTIIQITKMVSGRNAKHRRMKGHIFIKKTIEPAFRSNSTCDAFSRLTCRRKICLRVFYNVQNDVIRRS